MKKQNDLAVGDVVLSCAGRDKGYFFVVLWQEEDMLGLCDGKRHKASHIKRKKRKHVKKTGKYVCLSSYEDNRDGTLDAKIRGALREIS